MRTPCNFLAVVLILTGCAFEPQQPRKLCNRDAIKWDKLGEPVVPIGCAESHILSAVIENESEENLGGGAPGKPGGSQGSSSEVDTGDRPGGPISEPDENGASPDRPGNDSERPGGRSGEKQNNGLGNGDQTAPGNSLSHNRAENQAGNPGHASGKSQNSD